MTVDDKRLLINLLNSYLGSDVLQRAEKCTSSEDVSYLDLLSTSIVFVKNDIVGQMTKGKIVQFPTNKK